MELSAALMAEFNTLAVVYRQPSSAFLCTDPLPFCGRPAKSHSKAVNAKLFQQTGAVVGLLDAPAMQNEQQTTEATGDAAQFNLGKVMGHDRDGRHVFGFCCVASLVQTATNRQILLRFTA